MKRATSSQRLRPVPVIIGGAMLYGMSTLLLLASCSTTPRSPDTDPTTQMIPPQSPTARGLIVMVHGAKGTAKQWPLQFERLIRELDPDRTGSTLAAASGESSVSVPSSASPVTWDLLRVNWTQLSGGLRASGDGYRLGLGYGSALAGPEYSYEIIHLIAASIGAHLIHGMVKGYREKLAPEQVPAIIHMTFLDPFNPRGALRMRYGRREFGRYADFAENYFTRKEPMLFTNTPLRHAVNYDLTAVVPPRPDPHFTYYHDFPIWYYRDSIGVLKPGFSLSPFAQRALNTTPGLGGYDPKRLKEMLPAGEIVPLFVPTN